MLRLLGYLIGIAAMAFCLSWLADRPGDIVIDWLNHHYELTVFHAVILFSALVAFTVFAISLLMQLINSPAAIGTFIHRRRHKRGLEALSSGMIAIGAGDRSGATRHALAARRSLPNEPLTHLLRAQAAQLSGDKVTARRIFEAMLAAPDTEQLGLRGLFLEASRENEPEAARQYAERAVKLNPRFGWSVDALFELQCRQGDLDGALETLSAAKRNGQIDRTTADRRRAVLLVGLAQKKEDNDPEKALSAALEAHGLAPDLVPAAAIAGRLLASRGNTPRATRVIQRTWAKSPHPDLATAYAYARIGDSPRDRLTRVKQLTLLYPNSIESGIAIAAAAIEARDFDEARKALESLHDERLTQRVCLLMARVEGEQDGDKGRVREWLARAVHAPRDPTWTADGVVSDRWAPVSPVTGALDAYQWRVPVDLARASEGELMKAKLDELVALGAPTPVEAAAGPRAETSAAASAGAVTAAAAKTAPKRSAAVDAESVRSAESSRSAAAAPELEPDIAGKMAESARHSGPPEADDVEPQWAPAARGAESESGPTRDGMVVDRRVKPNSSPVGESKGVETLQPRGQTRGEPGGPARRQTREAVKPKPGDTPTFAAPRAPDDPGPDTNEPEEAMADAPRV